MENVSLNTWLSNSTAITSEVHISRAWKWNYSNESCFIVLEMRIHWVLSMIDTHFSEFSNLRTGVQIFYFCFTKFVGEKEVNTSPNSNSPNSENCGFTTKSNSNYPTDSDNCGFTISDTILFSKFLQRIVTLIMNPQFSSCESEIWTSYDFFGDPLRSIGCKSPNVR